MHLDWAGREQALGPDRQGAQRDRRSLFPFFAGAERGGAAEGCEGNNRWDVAEGELDCRRDACRLGDQIRTDGRAESNALQWIERL